jgi:hypothetical protein
MPKKADRTGGVRPHPVTPPNPLGSGRAGPLNGHRNGQLAGRGAAFGARFAARPVDVPNQIELLGNPDQRLSDHPPSKPEAFRLLPLKGTGSQPQQTPTPQPSLSLQQDVLEADCNPPAPAEPEGLSCGASLACLSQFKAGLPVEWGISRATATRLVGKSQSEDLPSSMISEFLAFCC